MIHALAQTAVSRTAPSARERRARRKRRVLTTEIAELAERIIVSVSSVTLCGEVSPFSPVELGLLGRAQKTDERVRN